MYDDTTQLDYQASSTSGETADERGDAYLVRLAARVIAGRLDRRLTAGAVPVEGSLLAAHARRLTSRDEREGLARALRAAVTDAAQPSRLNWRVPVHAESVLAASDLIDDITLRLHAPLPVRYRGVARLRVLMSEGTGPLYRLGRGSLRAELKAVLARL